MEESSSSDSIADGEDPGTVVREFAVPAGDENDIDEVSPMSYWREDQLALLGLPLTPGPRTPLRRGLTLETPTSERITRYFHAQEIATEPYGEESPAFNSEDERDAVIIQLACDPGVASPSTDSPTSGVSCSSPMNQLQRIVRPDAQVVTYKYRTGDPFGHNMVSLKVQKEGNFWLSITSHPRNVTASTKAEAFMRVGCRGPWGIFS